MDRTVAIVYSGLGLTTGAENVAKREIDGKEKVRGRRYLSFSVI